MSKLVKVKHVKGGSVTYFLKGRSVTLSEMRPGPEDIPEELFMRFQDRLMLAEDIEFIKTSPDYQGEPEVFKPRPFNPMIQRARAEVEKTQPILDDGLAAIKKKLEACMEQWTGKTDPRLYVEKYGKDNKKTELANEIIRLEALIEEAEVIEGPEPETEEE